ncbi:MAG: ThuA domain-containing protein [Planctomycetes bacterium]|nr:ThuA domain-containing protein [Planctomycetota bacterium]
MATRRVWCAALTAAAVACSSASALEEIPKHQAKKIADAAPEKPRVTPKKPRKVLVFSTPAHIYEKGDPHKGYCVPYGAAAFQALGEKSKAFEPVMSQDLAMFLPDNLKQFDAIVMNNSCGPWMTPTDADMEKEGFKKLGATKEAAEAALRKAFMDWVNAGGGIAAIHFAIAANPKWPEFGELIGGKFTGHPWNEEIGVMIDDKDSPLVAAWEGKQFRVADEIYQYGAPFDRARCRVLVSLDPERTNMGVRWINQPDNDWPLAWVKAVGKGRIWYTSFGHRADLFWNPQLLQFYLDGVQFATGDLDAPTEPRKEKLVRRVPGPTPPDVRAAKMKAGSVSEPTEEQLRKVEAAAPDTPPAKPSKPRKVLVWGHAWTHTPNAVAEKALEILGKKSGAFTPIVSDDPRLLLIDKVGQYDAIVMNNIHEPQPFLPPDFAKLDDERKAAARAFDAAVRKSILDYVGGKDPNNRDVPGRGIVGIHAATAAFAGWKEYGEMMGGFYSGHIYENVTIKLDDPKHPLNAAFEGKPFQINDEIYFFQEPHYTRKNLRILLTLDLDQMKDPGKRPDKDYAISWVREYGAGKGRVFYTTLGHALETYWNPVFLRHLLAGIQFATGDLAADAAPSAK